MAEIHHLMLNETDALIRLTKHLQVLKRQNMLLEEEGQVSYRNGYRDAVRDATDKMEAALCGGLADLKDKLLYAMTDLLEPLSHNAPQHGAAVNGRGDPF